MSIKIEDIQKTNAGRQKKPESSKSNITHLLNKDISFGGSGLKDKIKERFYSDFHMLLSSGIDLKSVLELIAEEQKKSRNREIIVLIRKLVVSGSSLSSAMEESGKFSNYEYNSVRIGEESGQLVKVLKELAEYYRKKLQFKRQILNALSYPTLILFTAIVAVIFMMNFIVPMFSDMFKQFGNELPSITVFMIDLSEMFSKYIWLMLLGLLSLIIIIYLIRSNLWFQKFWSFVVLGIPVVGKLTKKIYLSRFCHSMALMSSAKSPLIQSLDLVRTMLQFYPFDIALKAASKEVIRGAALNQALKKHKVFDRRMISLIKVAEEVNQLDAVFKRLYDQYQEEIESRIKTINSVLEPVLILLISALVGFILIAMYLPMFKMSGAVG